MKSIFRKLFINIQLSAMVVSAFFGVAARPGIAAEAEVDTDITEMFNWLVDNQLTDGSIPMYLANDGDAVIVPYFSSIAAIAILEYGNKQSLDAAEKYFDWYFAHLNIGGDDGAGSIYDYEAVIKDRDVISEVSRVDYDSADSYAALFLISLEKYINSGGDTEYIVSNLDKINMIIDLLMSLLDDDGLCIVSYTNHTKYLMDNCEVAAGLNSAAAILSSICLENCNFFSKEFWDTVKKIISLKKSRKMLIEAIETKMWSEDNGRYEVGIDKHGEFIFSDTEDEFYPDNIAQIFPIVFGAINPSEQKAKDLYNVFCSRYKWEEMEHYKSRASSFYWGITAYCGAIMQDYEKVDKYITNFVQLSGPEYKYPAYNADIAWVILAALHE